MEDRNLFKAKRLDNGEWVTGSLITCKDGTCKIAKSKGMSYGQYMAEQYKKEVMIR
jgi:hypothetical protein